MPRFEVTSHIVAREVTSARVRCDGCDPLRPCDEHAPRASLWILAAGAFELRDAAGRHVVDPTHALVMPAGHAYAIRHPSGPDICIAFDGPLVDRLAAAGGARRVPITSAGMARLAGELAAWRRGEGDELALAETLSTLVTACAAAVDRDLAAAIAHVLRLSFAEATSLTELADRTGYSVFHACRTFRATTGTTIHGFRRELRLRHALARIVSAHPRARALQPSPTSPPTALARG